MKNTIRTTLVFALVSGFLVLPVNGLLHGFTAYPTAFKFFIWIDLALYLLLLARWSRTRSASILIPLGLLLGAVFWPGKWAEFYALALGVLCWVRSGICFNHAPLRALAAELVTIVGGIILVGSISADSTFTWPLGLCLFFLVQALYFYIMPTDNAEKINKPFSDPFEQARYAAEKVLVQTQLP